MPVQRPVYLNPVTGELTRFSATDTIFEVDYSQIQNETGNPLVIGTPVYKTAVGSEVEEAQANALATARVFGLIADVSVPDASPGNVLTDGRLVATTGQWDAVTGQVGGLTPGAKYYLDAANPGQMTTTVPSADGHVVAPLGTAKSTTEFSVSIERLIVL